MNDTKHRVCPVKRAGSLDNRIRRWLQSPLKILRPYIKEGMVVLDVGCGPGFFSVDIAGMVGVSGRVIACDLQDGMLQILKEKIDGTEIKERITVHKCESGRLGVSECVDFVLAFYVVHEIPNQDNFFNEIQSILRPNDQILIVEPPFHTSKKEFDETIRKVLNIGFVAVDRPRIFLNKAVVLKIVNQPHEPDQPASR